MSTEPYGLSDIRDFIIPGVKLMLFSEIPIEIEVLAAMERVDSAFFELIARDVSWNEKKESYLKSNELTQLWKLFELLVQRLMISSHRYDIGRRLPSPFIEFMMKIISLLGVYGRGEKGFQSLERIALHTAAFLDSHIPILQNPKNSVTVARIFKSSNARTSTQS